MSDENQIDIPPSFVALYLDPGRSKPNAPRDVIATRYEFCEDLANLLTEHASNQLWELRVTEGDVLQRVQQGLLSGEAGVSNVEARWVICRLAELLNWECPAEPRVAIAGSD